ncbi:MAG: hypothetical protein CMJ19_04585 [Phycisphaeraceae bacterium]|nr:hypothetical protein [Phycisphaeraceae bacterium]
MTHMTRSQSAFTLIELLVVISIISILVAILLPALAKARSSARMAQCLSNIRSSALVITVYSNDYNSWTMKMYNADWDPFSGTTSDRYWPAPLGMGNYLPYFPEKGNGYGTVCPDAITSKARIGTFNDILNSYTMRGVDKMNTTTKIATNFRLGGYITNNGNATGGYDPEQLEEGPSDSVWLFDGCAHVGSGVYALHAGVDKGNFGPWHDGRGSVVFFDGHATVALRRFDYLYKSRDPNGVNSVIMED